MNLVHKINQIAQRMRLTFMNDENSERSVQMTTGGYTIDKIPSMGQYGLDSNPPIGATMIVLCNGGNTANGIAIASEFNKVRPKTLKEGEVVLYDDANQTITLSKQGIIIHTNLKCIIEAPAIELKGTVTITGSLKINGIPFETHIHTGVTPGGGATGPVFGARR
jgi:phage gp45-like